MANLEETNLQRPSTRTAAVSAAALIVIAAFAVPAAEQPWGERIWLIATLMAGAALLNGLTALLVALHVGANRGELPLAWVSGGYAFTAVLVALQLMHFSGLAPPGAEGEEVSNWLWVAWHSGLPLFVLLAVNELVAQDRERAPPGGRSGSAPLSPVFVGMATGIGVGVLLFMLGDQLQAVTETSAGGSALSRGAVGQIVMLLNLVALARLAYATRLRNISYQWLALALLAFNLDVLLNLIGAMPFSAGWYLARLMSVLAAGSLLVGLMVEQFRLMRAAHDRAEVLDDLAHRDSLTGLFNRRYFEAHLTHEFQRAKRYGHGISVLLIDLDHFKRINDRYGHLDGDACLKALGATLAARIRRAGEFAARYGGEEFAVVLPEVANDSAQALAEEIRREVEALQALGRSPHALTVSVGVATSNPREIEQTFNVLLSAADICLYQAKKTGRNRVVAADVEHGAARPQLQPIGL